MKTTTRQVNVAGTLKTTFGAAAIAAATVFAMGTTASPAYADNTTVSTAAGACTVGKDCTLEVIVKAGDGLHVNAEYNHKVKMNAAPGGITFTKEQFSKEGGDHAFRGETVGVITVHYKASAKGKVTLAGTYKYATCSEGKGGGCTPASAPFSVDVNVK